MSAFTTSTLRRCTVAATLIAVGGTALGVGATAAVAAEPAPGSPTAATTVTTAAEPAPADAAPTDAAPTDTAPTYAAPTAPADAAPAATQAGTVTISGTAMAWHTLTAQTAGWPEGTTFTYQWAYSFDGNDPVDFDGATAATITISPMNGALDRLVVRVTGTTPGQEPTTVTSAPTSPVAANPDQRWGYLGMQHVDASVGEPFTRSLAAFDGDGLEYFVNGGPDGSADAGVLPEGVTFSSDGTLSGTPTTPGYYSFWLHTSTGLHPNGTEQSQVTLSVSTVVGEATDLVVAVEGPGSATGQPVWFVGADGSVTYSDSPEVQTGDPATPLRVRQDQSLDLTPFALDANGAIADLGEVTWSSSVDGDTFTPSPSGTSVALRFAHASPHVVTARSGSLTRSFTVLVDPVATTAAVTTSNGATPAQLAYTGADDRGPIAWALGLLAAGFGLLVHRVRRRRA